MENHKILEGQSIQLTTNSIFYKNIYESSVLKVNNSTLEISTPYFKGLHVPLNIGFVLNLRLFTSDGVVSFTTEVIDRDVQRHSVTVKLPNYRRNVSEDTVPQDTYCKFVTVTSGKGGVGKTSFVINYSIALARLGKKVCLIDADLGMANVDVLLKTSTKYNIIDVISGDMSLKDIMVEAPGGIRIVAGGSGIQSLANLTQSQFARITDGFDYLDRNFDYVFIDTGAGLSTNVTNFIYAADETIVVTTPEPHAITDAYSIIKVILENDTKVKLKLIANKCETPQEGKEVLHRVTGVVRNFLNYSMVPIAYIMEEKLMSKSLKQQIPLILAYPQSDAAKCITAIAEEEVGIKQNSTEKNSGFVGKFKKLFGI